MRNKLIIFGLLVSMTSFGQDVVLQGNFKREVGIANRIGSNPTVIDTVIPEPNINYPLLALMYDAETGIKSIEPATIRIKEKLPQLYNSYVKLGVGTELMPLGEVYWDATRSRKYIYGAHVKHLSSFGNIPEYERATFDRTGVQLFGGINHRKYQLRGDLHYRNQGLHYYAIQAPLDSLGRDTTAQRYQDIGFAGSFASDAKIDTFNIDYNVGLKYNFFNTRKNPLQDFEDWRSREHFFEINGAGEYALGSEIYRLDASLKLNDYQYGVPGDSISALDTAIARQNVVFSLKPTIRTYAWNYRLKVNVGLDIVADAANGETTPHIYPLGEVKYSLFNDIFIPYVGIRGGLEQQSLKALTLENEFIRPNLQLMNEDKPFEFYGGFKGTLSKRIGFNVSAAYGKIRNKALFVTDTTYSPGNMFNVIYDTLNQMTIEGSISYQAREKLKLDFIGRYNSFELENNAYAWNLPGFQFITRAHYNLYDKLLVNLDFDLETGRRGLAYGEGEGIEEENGQYFKSLSTIYDVNLGVEYRYSPRISAFIQFNNIASQRYMRWYNAPVHSFQVLGGLTFRF